MDQYVIEVNFNILLIELYDLIEILKDKEDEKEKWEWLIEELEIKIKQEIGD